MWLFFLVFFIYISYILCISFRVRKFCMNIGLFHIYFMTTKYSCQKNFWEVGNNCLCCLFLINLTKINSYNQFNLTICIPDNFFATVSCVVTSMYHYIVLFIVIGKKLVLCIYVRRCINFLIYRWIYMKKYF